MDVVRRRYRRVAAIATIFVSEAIQHVSALVNERFSRLRIVPPNPRGAAERNTGTCPLVVRVVMDHDFTVGIGGRRLRDAVERDAPAAPIFVGSLRTGPERE